MFQHQNIGNLHLYTTPEDTDKSHKVGFFYGTPISPEFKTLLPRKLRPLVYSKAHRPEAVFRIKGIGSNHLYVLRRSSPDQQPSMVLYDMIDNHLKKVMTLASFNSKGAHITQIESWITDVNADGRLDVIRKIRRDRGSNQYKVRQEVHLMQPDGRFKKSRKDWNIQWKDYRMKASPDPKESNLRSD